MKTIYIILGLLAVLIMGPANAALLNPNTQINWSKTVEADVNFSGNVTIGSIDLGGNVTDIWDNATEQQTAIDALEARTLVHVQTWTAPGAKGILTGADALEVAGSDPPYVLDLDPWTHTQPDVARNLQVTPNASGTGNVSIFGKDASGADILEIMQWTSNGDPQATTRAFDEIERVVIFWDEVTTTFEVQRDVKLGSDIALSGGAVVIAWENNVLAAPPTLTRTASVATSLIQFDSVPDGNSRHLVTVIPAVV